MCKPLWINAKLKPGGKTNGTYLYQRTATSFYQREQPGNRPAAEILNYFAPEVSAMTVWQALLNVPRPCKISVGSSRRIGM
ncbi:hypothetical protein [Thermanaeromonas toyohensis]|uniref:hypothetical protein n=1 Tax=Thermanaeromonas toyohensis TaxID=161154 RepID=UPI0009FC20B0|nr:hypothetical protein [Thermanaeromonas toyohensis]